MCLEVGICPKIDGNSESIECNLKTCFLLILFNWFSNCRCSYFQNECINTTNFSFISQLDMKHI